MAEMNENTQVVESSLPPGIASTIYRDGELYIPGILSGIVVFLLLAGFLAGVFYVWHKLHKYCMNKTKEKLKKAIRDIKDI